MDILDAVYDVSSTIGLPDDNLSLVPSSISHIDILDLVAQKRNPEKLKRAVDELKRKVNPDFIMIDTHPGVNDEFLLATGLVDILLAIVRPDNQDYQGAQVTAEIAKKMKLTTYIVMNKVHHFWQKEKLMRKVNKAFNLPVAGVLPFTDKLMLTASEYIFTMKDPDSNFSREIQRIAATVFDIKPRTHLDAMHEILVYVKEGGSCDVEKIQKKLHMPFDKVNLYVDQLISEHFISKKKDKGIIEEKGANFLKRYKSINKFVKNFRL